MVGKIYQCQVCRGLVAVLRPGAGGLSCCGAALTDCGVSSPEQEEKQRPIDLIEVRVDGRSCWQILPPERRRGLRPIDPDRLKRPKRDFGKI